MSAPAERADGQLDEAVLRGTGIIHNSPPRLGSQHVPLLEYSFKHARRGLAVIINNFNFEPQTQQSQRDGTDVDAASLEKMFMQLNFDVERYDDLRTREMLRVLNDVAGRDHKDADCFACAVLSHGLEGRIFGVDGTVSVDTIVAPFKGDRCPSLIGKPKLFFLQACRGTKLDRGVALPMAGDFDETDSSKSDTENKIPCEADFLLAYAVGPGYSSWRNSEDGSWFVQALCRVFEEHAPSMEILHMLTYVNRIIAYEYESDTGQPWSDGCKQMPSIVSQLTKLLFFRPKY